MMVLNIFLLFESFPNALGELTLYGDREFYQDWWNATTIEEFYRKWLRFPYLFFYRHVYMELRLKHKIKPSNAKVVAGLANAAMQEIIVVCIISKLIPIQKVISLFMFSICSFK